MSIIQNWVDSFKRAPDEYGADPDYAGDGCEKEGKPEILGDENYGNAERFVETDDHRMVAVPEKSGLKRTLDNRHVQFIALGGGIGTGLFISSGTELATGGPGSLLINFIIIGIMLISVVFALGELAVTLPVSGAYSAYATRFIDPAWGFAMGYNYFIKWIISAPIEFTAATIMVASWDEDNNIVPKGALLAMFIFLITFINIFGVRGYAEFEFVSTLVKIITVIGLIIVLIVIDCGGTPNGVHLGAHTWHDPGSFNNAFKGFCSTFAGVAFAFSGSELVGLAAAETREPRKVLPKACQQIVVRILIFYILSLFLITLVVPYDHPRLQSGSGSAYDPSRSPFVIAMDIGKIKVLPHIINAVIILSTLSVSNAAVFASSRTLLSLAEQGFAPKLFCYVDRAGRPLPAVILTLLFSFISFLIYSADQSTVFSWLVGLSGLAMIFAWGSISLCHIRFRKAWIKQGNSIAELPWASPFGVTGSYIGLAVSILVVAANFYSSAFPIGEGDLSSDDRAYHFFEKMISLAVIIVFFVGYKLYHRTRIVSLDDMDLHTGRREAVPLEVLEQERAEKRARPLFKKLLGLVF